MPAVGYKGYKDGDSKLFRVLEILWLSVGGRFVQVLLKSQCLGYTQDKEGHPSLCWKNATWNPLYTKCFKSWVQGAWGWGWLDWQRGQG